MNKNNNTVKRNPGVAIGVSRIAPYVWLCWGAIRYRYCALRADFAVFIMIAQINLVEL
jgi:hypothetical protein